MDVVRSERLAAGLLIAGALVGLGLANSPASATAFAIRDLTFGPMALHLHLSLSDWIKDGLLAVFFFMAAVELRHELTHGELDSPRKAMVPAVAALGGVAMPALIFLAVVRDPTLSNGWPIPTATDIAFALGLLSIAGRGLPPRIRATLLALAVLDDLIAITLIAVLFTANFHPVPLLVAVLVIALFGVLSTRLRPGNRIPLTVALVVLGVIAWALVHASGIHATVAGVALGLVMASRPAETARLALEPWSNALILPIFALVASLVEIPKVGIAELSPVFWGIVIALPVGKLVGITGGGMIARTLLPRRDRAALPPGDIVVIAGLSGVGLTVSLLMNSLAYAGHPGIAAEGTIAVLVGSLVAILLGGTIASVRAAGYRRRAVG